MYSISQSTKKLQAPVLSYSYALNVTQGQIEQMNTEQLRKLCLEQYFLLWLIISIIRNPLAAIATRVLAIDLIVSMVEKNIRGNVKTITERSRVYISGDGGIAKRLGVHANTVSKCFKNLERHQLIKREYIFDEEKEREYLDITITDIHLTQPQRLQDKTLRKVAEAGKKEQQTQQTDAEALPLTCPACESSDVIAVCRTCGTSGDIQNFTLQGQMATFITRVSDNTEKETPPLLNKIYVDTNNAPQESTIVVESDPVLLTSIVESVLTEMKQPEVSPTPQTPGKQLVSWLTKRIGHGKIIYATGSPDTAKKYLAKPADYSPDFKKHLLGDKEHMYGSYLLRDDGTTYVLAFDFDTKEEALHDKHEILLTTLAHAGASPIYWLRQNKRGHLELYFDQPVDPDAAHAWCIQVCPELAFVEEVYPSGEKRNNPISWPMYQRKGTTVLLCQPKAALAVNPQNILAPEFGMKAIATLISQAITPASLIPERRVTIAQLSLERAVTAPSQEQQPLSDTDIARMVIAEYNKTTTWEEIIALCGGANRDGKFNAAWRGETSNSVKVDADGQYACDYGRTAGYPKKLDKYEIYCLVNGGRDFKKKDLAERCRRYRETQDLPIEAQQPQPLQIRPSEALQQSVVRETDETPDEVVARLRRDIQATQGYVITPKGIGKLWQLWPERIGVVLEGQDRVSFFSTLSEIRQIRAYNVAEAQAL